MGRILTRVCMICKDDSIRILQERKCKEYLEDETKHRYKIQFEGTAKRHFTQRTTCILCSSEQHVYCNLVRASKPTGADKACWEVIQDNPEFEARARSLICKDMQLQPMVLLKYTQDLQSSRMYSEMLVWQNSRKHTTKVNASIQASKHDLQDTINQGYHFR